MTPEEKKEAAKEYNKKYRLEHKEDLKERHKKYRLEHKDEIKKYKLDHTEEAKEYFKKYNLEHKEEAKEYNKEYYLDHKEYNKERFKKYHLEHKEYNKEYNKEYYLEHKEYFKKYNKEYLATSKGKEAQARGQIQYYQTHPEVCVNLPARNYVTKVIKPEILLRDCFTCQLCKKTEGKLVIHHIIPVKYDKDDQNIKNPENLITLCPTCHKTAHMNNWSKVDSNLGSIFIKYTKSKKKTVEEPVD